MKMKVLIFIFILIFIIVFLKYYEMDFFLYVIADMSCYLLPKCVKINFGYHLSLKGQKKPCYVLVNNRSIQREMIAGVKR